MAMTKQNIATEELVALLSRASESERLNLSKILEPSRSHPMSPDTLSLEIGLAGGHGIANLFRGGTGIGYLEVLQDALGELGLANLEEKLGKFEGKYWIRSLEEISHPPQEAKTKEFLESRGIRTQPYTERELTELRETGNRCAENFELRIIRHILKATYDKLKPEEKERFHQELARVASSLKADTDPKSLVGTAALMAVANLGGFATYTLMSSILSTVSLGALGFGAYTAASSLLSIAIGPVGWVALGTVAAYKLGKPNLEKTVPFAATVGMIRQRIKAGHALSQPVEKETLEICEQEPVTEINDAYCGQLVQDPLAPCAEVEDVRREKTLFDTPEVPTVCTVQDMLRIAGWAVGKKMQDISELIGIAELPPSDDFVQAVNKCYMYEYRWPKGHIVIYNFLVSREKASVMDKGPEELLAWAEEPEAKAANTPAKIHWIHQWLRKASPSQIERITQLVKEPSGRGEICVSNVLKRLNTRGNQHHS